MNRNNTITYTKAVGIMLMVLCHCSSFGFLYRFVYMFHMPLFFIVAGYCFNTKYLDAPHVFVWKRIKGLYWPYVKYGLLFLAFHNVFFSLNIYNDKYGYNGGVSKFYVYDDFINQVKNIVLHMEWAEMLLGGYWFLNSLFWGSLIAFGVLWLFHLTFKKHHDTYIANIIKLGGAIVMLFFMNSPYRTFTSFHIGPQAFLAATFFLSGHFLRVTNARTFTYIEIILSALVISIGGYCWQMSAGDTFHNVYYLIPYIITAILGTWSVYSMPWKKMPDKFADIMDYIGNHTLSILTWHFLSFKLVSLLIIWIYDLPIEQLAYHPAIGEFTNRGWFVLYFIVGIAVPLLITYSSDKLVSAVMAKMAKTN